MNSWPKSPDAPTPVPGRTPSPTPAPTHSRPQYPEKTVTLLRCPCSGAAPYTSHTRPTTSPRLRRFYPRIRPNPEFSPGLLNYTHMRAILAHARDRPRGLESLAPIGIYAPGIRRGIPCGCPGDTEGTAGPPLRPSVIFRHAARHLCSEITRRAPRIGAGPPALPATSTAECRRKEHVSPSRFRGNNGVGGDE